MQKICLILIVSFFISFPIISHATILISAEVTHGYFQDYIGGNSQIEYNVKINFENKNVFNLIYDEVELSFVPASGKKLIFKSFAYDEKHNGNFELLRKYPRLVKLKSGASDSLEYRTNRYTVLLLKDASGMPLYIFCSIKRRGKIIIGPYKAILPILDNTPSYNSVINGKSKPIILNLK